MAKTENIFGELGGGKPTENVETSNFSLSGVNTTKTVTFSKKVKLLIISRSGSDIYVITNVNSDGTTTELKRGTSAGVLFTIGADGKTVTITSSWSASAYYFVTAITTDDLDEIDYTST